jgi:hypothetical protein
MEKRFYVVEKQLRGIDIFEETTGWSFVFMYDIDTQAMDMVEVCRLEIRNEDNPVSEVKQWLLENGDDREYGFIQL